MAKQIIKKFSTIQWGSAFVLILSALGLAVWTASNKAALPQFFIRYSYYAVTVLFLAWLYTLVYFLRAIEFSFVDFFKRHYAALLSCFVVSVLVFLSVGPYFRVLSDETNLLSVSRSMLLKHTVENVTQAKWDQFNFFTVEAHIPKRPFVFPYFVHLLHLLLGFNAKHAFVVNFFALWMLLSTVCILSQKYWGRLAAAVTVLLIIAQPVVTQTAASGAFDLFFAAFLVVSVISFAYFVLHPSQAAFAFFWMQFLLLSNIRYEGPIYFAVLLVLLVVCGYAKKTDWANPWLLGLTPLLSLPIIWQRFYFKFDYEITDGRDFFSIQNFFDHQLLFLKELFNFDFFMPYAGIVNILGVAGLLYLIYFAIFKSRRALSRPWVFILYSVLAVFLIHWIILNALGGETLTGRDGSRLWTLSSIVFSLCAAWVLHQFSRKRGAGILSLVIAFSLFGIYHPVSIESRSHAMNLPREHRSVLDVLDDYPQQNAILISYRPGIYTALGYASVNFKYANLYKEVMLDEIKEHYYREVYVLQEIQIKTGKPTERTALDPAYRLQKVRDLQDGVPSDVFLRVSKVVSVA